VRLGGEQQPVPEDVAEHLLSTLREALANVARHAAATRVGVTLSYMEHEVALDVRDDGRGFDPGVTGYGTGLQGMEDRLAALGGELVVTSSPGGGTAVAGRLPVEATA